MSTPGTRRLRRLAPALCGVLACALLAAGCERDGSIERRYGRSHDTSINGVRVFAELLEKRGHRVRRAPALDHRYVEDADVLVFVAPDPAPLPYDVLLWFEDWLIERPARTLAFIGRDFDADVHLFEDLAGHLDRSGEEDVGLQARARHKLALYELEKQALEMPDGRPVARYPFALDGTVEPDLYPAPLDAGGMADAAERAGGARLYLRLYPEPWSEAAALADPGLAEPEAAEPEPEESEERWRDELEALAYIAWAPVSGEETLLASDGRPLVSVRIVPVDQRGSSRAILVHNASFLLNYSLIDPAHRELAGALEEQLGEDQEVVFFEPSTGSTRAWFFGPDPPSAPNPLEALLEPPMRWVFLHFLLAGLLLLAARALWMGRARAEPEDPAVPFADHVRAYGRMLERTGDRAHAEALIEEYRTETRSGR